VRKLLALGLLLIPVYAHAQEQERKLIDRIMKPDMTLENEAQSKKFTADRTSVKKPARVNTFYLQQKPKPKAFAGTRDYTPKEFGTRTFNSGNDANTRRLSQQNASARTFSDGSKTESVRSVYDHGKGQQSRQYTGNRPFVEEGKSQKSLSRKNPPLTIEQVRELLNKNK